MTDFKELFAGFRQQRREEQQEQRNLRMAKLGVSRLVFPTRPQRIMFGVGFGVYAIACFYQPWWQGTLFDGLTRFLILVIALCAMYIGGYRAKVAALRKLIEMECPALEDKIRKSAGDESC